MAKSSVWKFQFNDEQTAYLKCLLDYTSRLHEGTAANGAQTDFNRMAHRFCARMANELLLEINNITG